MKWYFKSNGYLYNGNFFKIGNYIRLRYFLSPNEFEDNMDDYLIRMDRY